MPKPQRNPKYLAFIRSLPCTVCKVTRGVQAAHTGPHGMGQKSSDLSAIPLCHEHHTNGRDSYHVLGPRKFGERHNLNVSAIVRRLNAKPQIRIETGQFVAYFESEAFLLGPTDAGIEPALSNWRRLRQDHFARSQSRLVGGLREESEAAIERKFGDGLCA